jgi:RHS repeat-associated protein
VNSNLLNRVVETYAPAIDGQTGASLGITEFGISTVQDYVGTYTTATDASGRRARSITNALGQLVRIDEPTGTNNDLGLIGSPNQPTFYKYNPQGKMVHVIQGKLGEPAIQHRYFLYDYLGRLIRVKQPEQEVNPLLNTTQTVDGNNEWTAKMEYDLVGNLIKTTDAENKQITNFYDKANRVTKREYSNLDTPTVFYYYDGTGLGTVPDYSKGKLTKVSSSISATQYTSFDNFGRTLTSEQITDEQTYSSKYKYSLSGALLEQTYPSGKVVRNFFESDGDLAKIVRNGKVYASDLSYSPTKILEKIKLGNGLWESAKLNERQQVTEMNLGTSPTDSSKWQVKYEYGELDANGNTNIAKNTGNISKQTINFNGLAQPFVQTYKYDSLNRITEAKENNGTPSGTQNWKQTYDYDRFGNRIAFSQVVGTTTLAINNQTLPSIDPTRNRFAENQGFLYDKTGNITQEIDKSTNLPRTMVFNGDNKQLTVKNSSGTPIGTYYYDGTGLRVKKTTLTETTIFVYDGSKKLVAEYSTATPPTNPTVSYTATDTLGSPRVITDKNGNVTSRRDFMPFGEEIGLNTAQTVGRSNSQYNATDNIRQKFTGYEKDKETDLDYAQARYYNSQHGRFTAVDPLLASGKSSNPQSFNRYAYTMNQPTTKTDSTGLQIGDCVCRIYFNSESGAFGSEGFSKAHPELNLKPFVGKAIEVISKSDGYTYRLEEGRATQLGKAELLKHQSGNNMALQGMENLPPEILHQMEQELIAGGKEIGNALYKIAPDAVGAQYQVPILGGLGIQISKDGTVLGSHSKGLLNTLGDASSLSDIINGDLRSLNPRGGLSVGATYFVPSPFADMKNPYAENILPEDRDEILKGTDWNINLGFFSYDHSLDGGEPDSVTIGVPAEVGTGITNTTVLFHIFQNQHEINRLKTVNQNRDH